LFGGGFVVRESEAVGDAGAVDGVVDEEGAPTRGGINGFQDAGAKGQGLRDFFGVGFDAGDERGVLIKKNEKEKCDGRKSREMPFFRGERTEETESVDGGDESEARNEQTDPARVLTEPEVFREKRSDTEGNGAELEKEKAVFPPNDGAWRAAEVQSGHEEAEGEDDGGDVAVAFAENEELVGAIEKVEGLIGPTELIA